MLMHVHYASVLALTLIASLALLSASNAMYLQITEPIQATLHQNSSIYIGKVGPGESFYIEASATTTNSNGVPVNIGWDTLETVSLPSGWSSQASPLYENPMKLKVTVAPYAANGTYAMKIKAINVQNYSKLGNLTITAIVNVTPDVFGLNVTPLVLRSGIGQPANLHVLINNTGASDDPFIVSSSGLPAFNLSYEVIAIKGKPILTTYPVYENEPGTYQFTVSVVSATSPLVHRSFKAELIVNSSVANDYSAVGRGLIVEPIIYEPAYALMLLIDKLSKI
ncbi:MAG: hypothetical protein QXV13_02000 [Candidatus Micrarchaeaceae archaeon]